MGLQVGRHVDGIVDAYYGPPELAAEVDAAPPVDPHELVVAALCGLLVLGLERRLVFSGPVLPEFLKQVTIQNLRIGEACVDVSLTRNKEDVRIDVLRKQGDLKIVVLNSDLSLTSSSL